MVNGWWLVMWYWILYVSREFITGRLFEEMTMNLLLFVGNDWLVSGGNYFWMDGGFCAAGS